MVYAMFMSYGSCFTQRKDDRKQIAALKEFQQRTIHHHRLAPLNIIHQITQMGLVYLLNMGLHNEIISHLVHILDYFHTTPCKKGTVSITFKSFQGSVSEIKADEAI